MDEAEEVPKLALGRLRSTGVCKEDEAQVLMGSSGESERSRCCSVLVEDDLATFIFRRMHASLARTLT